jgi:hypothetical protein
VPRKTKKTPDIVATVAVNVKKDWPVTCKDITFAYGGNQWDKAQHSLRKPRVDQEWFFHRNKILVPTADIMLMWMTANKIQQLQHPPYMLNLAPEAYFFFSGVKEMLAGAVLTLESFKKIWGGVGRNIDIDQFGTGFSR